MSWYDVTLPSSFLDGIERGRTKVFGRVQTTVHFHPRHDTWFVRATWDLQCRILLSTENIRASNALREAQVLVSLRTFSVANGRPPTADEAAQITAEALRLCDQFGPRAQTVDGTYNHELAHVYVVTRVVELDVRGGVLHTKLDEMTNAVFATEVLAEAYATSWRSEFLARLRSLVNSGAGHAIAAGAALGGSAGATFAWLGLGLAPPSGAPVAGAPAPAPAGGQAEWDTELAALLAAGYLDLAP